MNYEINPFRKSASVIRNFEQLVGRRVYKRDLLTALLLGENTVMLGVEGIGKSSLLNSVFNLEFIKETVKSQKKLIVFADISGTHDDIDLCTYLTDRIVNAVRTVIEDDEDREYLLASWTELSNDKMISSAKAIFENYIDIIFSKNYQVVLVMDCFERFTTDDRITKAHHDMFLALVEQGKLQCIVATNYDLNQDSLPPTVTDSLYLQRFHNRIEIKPFSLDETKEFIDLKMKNNNLRFNEAQIKYLYQLSGGIPFLLELCANYSFSNLIINSGSLSIDEEFERELYKNMSNSYKRWFKYLTHSQVKVLNLIKTKCRDKDINEESLSKVYFRQEDLEIQNSAEALFSRGILIGNAREGYYSLNSRFLELFVLANKIEEFADKNPLFQRAVDIQQAKTVAARKTQLELEKLVTEIERNKAQTVTYITASQFIEKINLNNISRIGLLKHGKLSNNFETIDVDVIDEVKQLTVSNFNIDEESVNDIDDVEMKNIDDYFIDIRNRMNLDENLNDEYLNTLSPLCRFYVKAALIVEDHMNSIANVINNDCSTQLVMYGKCLEQCLRDNMFMLFNTCDEFKYFDTRLRSNAISGLGTFGKMKNETDARIGTFCYMIFGCKEKLSKLCTENNVFFVKDGKMTIESKSAWLDWWDTFAIKLDKARLSRNLLHADRIKQPTANTLATFREALFAKDGIMRSSKVPSDLYYKLTRPNEKELTDDRIAALRNTEHLLINCVMESNKKNKKSISGKIITERDEIIQCHLAFSEVKRKAYNVELIVSDGARVKIESYDSSKRWFNVKLV